MRLALYSIIASFVLSISAYEDKSHNQDTRLKIRQNGNETYPSVDEDLVWFGTPLFFRFDMTPDECRALWLNHASVVAPWLLSGIPGFVEYRQIHYPDGIDRAVAGLVGDGIGIGLLYASQFEEGRKHPYFDQVIIPDERRFLHEESGTAPVQRDPPAFTIPEKPVLEWRELALKAGATEYRMLEGGKMAVEIPDEIWQRWEEIDGSTRL